MKRLGLVLLSGLFLLTGCGNNKKNEIISEYNKAVSSVYNEIEVVEIEKGYIVYTCYSTDKKDYLSVWLYDNGSFINIGYKEIVK